MPALSVRSAKWIIVDSSASGVSCDVLSLFDSDSPGLDGAGEEERSCVRAMEITNGCRRPSDTFGCRKFSKGYDVDVGGERRLKWDGGGGARAKEGNACLVSRFSPSVGYKKEGI